MWEPAGSDAATVATQLRGLGAREWQIELTAPMLAEAVAGAGSAG
jgi:ribonuclease D